jgi:capsule polysaccharide export protein KpsE/RkpR
VQSLGNNLVMVGATHEQANFAQQMASALITTYHQWLINSDQQESRIAQQFFADQIQKYREDVSAARDALKAYLEQNPDPTRGDRPTNERIEIEQLQSAIDLAQKQLVSALDKEENARLNLSRAESDVKQKYYVVDAPNLPDTPENSKKQAAINSAIFVAVGFVLTLVGIVGGALLDTACRFPLDVRHGLNLPVLANIPELDSGKRKSKK